MFLCGLYGYVCKNRTYVFCGFCMVYSTFSGVSGGSFAVSTWGSCAISPLLTVAPDVCLSFQPSTVNP